MRPTTWLLAALWLAGMSSAHAQRRFRIGPTYSSLSLDDGSGSSHSFPSWGGSAALITGAVGDAAVASIAGRFLEVPGSQIQAVEAVANASIALGAVRKGEFLEGTVGPAASVLIPISGGLHARAPFLGARFRRETKKAGTLG